MFARIKISNEECILALTEINGVVPENWFIAKNKGKDKKINCGFLVNNTEETIQLIPIKKEKKAHTIDKDTVLTYSKIDNIKSVIVVADDTHSHLRIRLIDGTFYNLKIPKFFVTKERKSNFKIFRTAYKEQSKKAQLFSNILNASIVVFIYSILAIELLTTIPNDTVLYEHYNTAYDLKQTVDNGYFDEYMAVTLEQYPYSDIKLDDSYTVTHGNIKISLPKECQIKEETLEDSIIDGFVTYTTGYEKETALNITIDDEPLDYSTVNDEEYKDVMNYIGKASIKEFGVPLDNHYNLTKAMWQMSELDENINYFSRREVALYRFMLIMKMTMSSGVSNYYEVKTPSYCGFVSVRNLGDNNSLSIVNLDLYSYDNLDQCYMITIYVKNGDVNDAFKILNSVELVT